MSASQDQEALDNGAEIIRRFGGIRPMAGKIDIPVTTVQGWKKRDTIPAARRDLIIKAAQEHDVNLVDLVPELAKNTSNDAHTTGNATADKDQDKENDRDDHETRETTGEPSGEAGTDTGEVSSPAANTAQKEADQTGTNTNNDPSFKDMVESDKAREQATPPQDLVHHDNAQADDRNRNDNGQRHNSEPSSSLSNASEYTNNSAAMAGSERGFVTMEQVDKKLAEMRRKTTTRALWTSVIIVVVVLGGAAFLLWPQAENIRDTAQKNNERLVAIEKDVSNLDQKVDEMQGKRGSFFGGVLPDNVNRRLEELGAQTTELRAQVGTLSTQAQELAGQVMGPEGSTLNERLARLESKFQEFTGSETFRNMLLKIQTYRNSFDGEQQLDAAMQQLQGVISEASASDIGLEKALEQARGQDTELGKALEGVEDNNLRAAAMLLAFTQIRSSLARDRDSFESDLEILNNLVGEDNQELKQAINNLAPKAREGVLTPDGLSKQLRGLSGEIVTASLKGEDVSVQEKAKARLNELLSVEKNDELLTGTDTQQRVARAQKLLDEGRVEEAIAELQALEGPSQNAAQPIIDEAQATLLAKKVEAMLKDSVVTRLATGNGSLQGGIDGKQLIRNLKRELDAVTRGTVTHDKDSGLAILPKKQLP